MSIIPIFNNQKVPIQLAGTEIRLPAKQWTNVPFHIAIQFTKDPGLILDYKAAEQYAVDWRDGKRHIAIASPFNPYDGYGLVGIHAVKGLEDRGLSMHISSTNSVVRHKHHLSTNYPWVDIIARKRTLLPKWGLSHFQPPDFDKVTSVRRIGWTMFESTRIPKNWLPYFDLIERLIVPSHGQIPIFRDSGVKVPIHVVPDGVDFDAFCEVERPERDTFTFITWGRLSSRKCPIETVECFIKAFPKEDDVRLILKTREHDLGGGKIVPDFSDPRVTVIDANWSLPRLVQFVHDADCGIFLSHGEGFYQPPIQAMATCLPVIMISHSGCTDSANIKYNYPIGLDPKQPFVPSPMAAEYKESDKLSWWQPDYEQAVEMMRYVYQHRKQAQRKGQKAAQWVRKKFSIDVMCDKLASLLLKLD